MEIEVFVKRVENELQALKELCTIPNFDVMLDNVTCVSSNKSCRRAPTTTDAFFPLS